MRGRVLHLNRKNVAVIGAGIGGLAAALALARRGARVTVYEQTEALGEVGAGLQVSPNGVRVLRALGLDPIAGNAAAMPPCVELRDFRTGRAIVTLPMNQTAAQPFVQLHRADLVGILARGCEGAGVAVRFGEPAEVVDSAQGTVLCPAGRGDTQDFDVIVAADGIRSPSRADHLAGKDPRFTGQVAWRALIPARAVPEFSEQTGTRIYLGPHRHIVCYPLRNRSLINLVAVEERETWTQEGWNHADDVQNLHRAFDGWCAYVTRMLAQVKEPLIWGLFTHPELPRWSAGKLALLGDAAHPTLPFMAQGACMALEDAWVLAEALDNDADTGTALRAYENIRKPRASRVQATSRGNSGIYHAANPLLRVGLHMGMRTANRVAPKLLSRRYDWIYEFDVTAKRD